MKHAFAPSILILILGTTALAYARQEKGQEEHKQESSPAQHQAKPQQQRQNTAEAHKQVQHSTPAPQQHTEQTPHTQPQRSQQAAHTEQPPQSHASNQNRGQQGNTGRSQEQARQTHAVAENRGGSQHSQHGRISNDHYASNFGSGHRFHVNRGEYNSRRFAYGGYSFGFIDPWPVAWGYSDDVYVVYSDGGYYMYDYVHPGVRISLNIL
jgi:hypothetical protein